MDKVQKTSNSEYDMNLHLKPNTLQSTTANIAYRPEADSSFILRKKCLFPSSTKSSSGSVQLPCNVLCDVTVISYRFEV
jgi:hypothetical protein